MSIWTAPMPYYSEYFDNKRRPSTQVTSLGLDSDAAQRPTTASPTGAGSLQSDHPSSASLDGAMFEASLDSPPSPERIRQLSKQMRRASHLNQANVNRASSSRSSSIRSITDDRSSWDQSLENSLNLVRRPSERSNGSSAPSRERPESVQGFGRNLFQRLGKSTRDSTAHSSSAGSSIYSTEQTADTTAPNNSSRESIVPSLFSLRRPSRDDSAQRRLRISSPFNFQHVTHTQREQLPNLQRGNRMDLVEEFSAIRTTDPSSGPASLAGIDPEDIHSPNFRLESKRSQDDFTPSGRPPLIPRHTAPGHVPHTLLKKTRSQDHLRLSPPPRSLRRPSAPFVTDSTTIPAVPSIPPRGSSWQQNSPPAHVPEHDVEFSTVPFGERPLGSAGFRRPHPYSPRSIGSTGQSELSPRTQDHPPVEDVEAAGPSDRPISYALTTPDDLAWPLGPNATAVPFESPLPDVPEEEEHSNFFRKARASVASNSSLRGSQSVPMLRSLAQSQRPDSRASETLGHFDRQLARRGSVRDSQAIDLALAGNWEDAIDYCYEHEAEADCDYQWERSSLDIDRAIDAPPVQVAYADELSEARPIHTNASSPGFLSATGFDVPALSPVSQASTATGQDLPTPVSYAVTNNFSLPRIDRKSMRPSKTNKPRPISVASSFKEVHGFTLSPSLLIPGDYHHQMLLTASEKNDILEEDETIYTPYDLDMSASQMSQKSSLVYQRSSTSTTATSSTRRSDSIGDRHVSTHSNYTNLTRLTASSTSLNKLAGSWSEAADPVPEQQVFDSEAAHIGETDDETTPPASQDVVPELTPFPTIAAGRKVHHKTHASESLAQDEVAPLQPLDGVKARRPRARTTSVSGNTPPVGQYALFPREYVKPTGERI
ncbi:hypothetical protein B0I35DRAFT_106720 [Stachybotrys elegans]|uniref:CRIB domain-containing protein n=1 Tax=Stachybotrys elegans TaxID=80388 RepID=A0A8K0SKQ3_9HYPO|nr:hypothetical protein B0I35DRAFT_106720 [Stachybotrys elegans]